MGFHFLILNLWSQVGEAQRKSGIFFSHIQCDNSVYSRIVTFYAIEKLIN